jgi:hypothetical protein
VSGCRLVGDNAGLFILTARRCEYQVQNEPTLTPRVSLLRCEGSSVLGDRNLWCIYGAFTSDPLGPRGGSDAPPDPLRAARQPGLTDNRILITAGERDPICPPALSRSLHEYFEQQGAQSRFCSIPVVTSWCRRRAPAPPPLSLKQHRLDLRTCGGCPELPLWRCPDSSSGNNHHI